MMKDNRVTAGFQYRIFCMVLIFVLLFNINFNLIASYAAIRPAANEIPVGSLVVGTYIIAFDALDSEVMKLATDSAAKYGQEKQYYRSALASGNWYDITDADNIDAILKDKGKIVTFTEIDSLKLTHWAKAPGEIIDLETGKKLTSSDLDKIEGDLHESIRFLEEAIDDAVTKREIVGKFYSNEEDDDKKDELKIVLDIYNQALYGIGERPDNIGSTEHVKYLGYKDILSKIDDYKEYINSNFEEKRESYVEEIMKLRESKKSEMYIYIAQVMDAKMNYAINRLNDESFFEDTEPLSKASGKIQEYVMNLVNTLSSEEETVLGKEYTSLTKKLYDSIIKVDYKTADYILTEISAIHNIKNDSILDIHTELTVLFRVFQKEYAILVKQIVFENTTEYLKAVANKESQGVITKLRNDHSILIEAKIEDIRYLVKEIIKRLNLLAGDSGQGSQTGDTGNQGSQTGDTGDQGSQTGGTGDQGSQGGDGQDSQSVSEFLTGAREDVLDSMVNTTEQDTGEKGYTDAVLKLEGLADFFSGLINEVNSGLDEALNENRDKNDALKDKIAGLRTAYLDAVENGDMNAASKLKDEINALNNQLENSDGLLYGEINSLLEEKKELQAQLSSLYSNSFAGDSLSSGEISGVQARLDKIDAKLFGLNSLLPEKDTQLATNFSNSANELLDALGDINNLGEAVDIGNDLLNAFSVLPDSLKSLLYDEDMKQDILNSLNTAIAVSTDLGDDTQAGSFLSLKNKLTSAFDELSMTFSERAFMKLLEKIIATGEFNSEIKKLAGKYNIEVRAIQDLTLRKKVLQKSATTAIVTAYSGDITSLLNKLDDTIDMLLVKEKEMNFVIIDMAESVIRQKVKIDATNDEIVEFKEAVRSRLFDIELNKYPKSMINAHEANKKLQKSVVKGINIVAADRFVTRHFNIYFDKLPFIKDGVLYIPYRTFLEELGADVTWVPTKRQAAINYNGMEIIHVPETNYAYINDKKVSMSNASIDIEGVTFVPVSFLKYITNKRIESLKDSIWVE